MNMNSIRRSLIRRSIAFTAAGLVPLLAPALPRLHGQDANTKTGDFALASNTTGDHNTANGHRALQLNTEGSLNTGTGSYALANNSLGNYNTADGAFALADNTTGGLNTAVGAFALQKNTTGGFNIAIGYAALLTNTTGLANTAQGYNALRYNATGKFNTAIGSDALSGNNKGNKNTALGSDAMFNNMTGNRNTVAGVDALYNNIAGNNNIAVGFNAGRFTTGSGNILIGSPGAADESNTIRLGKSGTQTRAFVAGIFGTTVAKGVQVVANSSGKLGTIVSSARFKEEIKRMDDASDTLLALQPVTFRYNRELDPDGTPQFGLVAEEVEKVNPDLVIRDSDGKVNTVRYEAINAMLLNEFLKEHRTVQEQQEKIARLESAVREQQAALAEQQKQIAALTEGLQKVSNKVELAKPKRRVAARRR